MGALKTKRININNVVVKRKLSWGLSNKMTRNALRKNIRVRMEPVDNRAQEAREETVNSDPWDQKRKIMTQNIYTQHLLDLRLFTGC